MEKIESGVLWRGGQEVRKAQAGRGKGQQQQGHARRREDEGWMDPGETGVYWYIGWMVSTLQFNY
jgi:hypothetical protein